MFKNKFVIFAAVVVLLVLVVSSILNSSKKGNNVQGGLLTKSGNSIAVGNDVCSEFPKSWVESAMGKTVLSTKDFHANKLDNCQYLVDNTNSAFIKAEDLSIETQKTGQKAMGRTIKSDSRIPMENYIAWQETGLINVIYLVLSPNRYVAIDRTSTKVYGNEEGMIAFAIKVAQRIINKENQAAGQVVESTSTTKTTAPLPQEKDVVNSFFNLINEHKPSDAVKMLTEDVSNDDKQAWAVAFNAFESVSVKSVDASMPEEWSDGSHTYKVVLDVKMKPEAANAQPMPYYGWDNGEVYRWITLNKEGSLWKIKGIATGP
jgi:hypothetical protein